MFIAKRMPFLRLDKEAVFRSFGALNQDPRAGYKHYAPNGAPKVGTTCKK